MAALLKANPAWNARRCSGFESGRPKWRNSVAVSPHPGYGSLAASMCWRRFPGVPKDSPKFENSLDSPKFQKSNSVSAGYDSANGSVIGNYCKVAPLEFGSSSLVTSSAHQQYPADTTRLSELRSRCSLKMPKYQSVLALGITNVGRVY